ncbi:hypothetical protein Pst134EA_013073 [Puccinia striiformis f. sp. tritici]|nr:hypothetical protein Pst134EA_013073 [Puccinia striiformis f. sp. tritici]KAH9465180.1 hypothetical protein Pst134EA_013073 [Puccinia striiformis f. sp. tritici]
MKLRISPHQKNLITVSPSCQLASYHSHSTLLPSAPVYASSPIANSITNSLTKKERIPEKSRHLSIFSFLQTSLFNSKKRTNLMSTVNSLTVRSSSHTISISRAWSAAEFQLVGVVFGVTLGFGYFVVCHASRQARRLNIFTVLVWLGISSNLASALLTFLFASGVINTSVPYYLCVVNLWAIQLNCVFQIMVSRIILIWSSTVHRRILRWGIFMWALVLTAAVFSTWIPARLRISDKFIQIDTIWYRATRVICLLTNACLNFTFIYSVKQTLVANGLKKYNKLLRFNAKILALSLILDLVPILLLLCHSSLLYISFFPLSTMVKLETELVTNDLIVDVINSEQQLRLIRDSQFIVSPGYPTFGAIDSPINTPRTCMFGDEDTSKSSRIKELSHLNLSDMWKLPPIGLSISSPPSIAIGKGAPTGLFFHPDDHKLDPVTHFGTYAPYNASPIDSESEDWIHSRMSSGYSMETDLTVELWHRGF